MRAVPSPEGWCTQCSAALRVKENLENGSRRLISWRKFAKNACKGRAKFMVRVEEIIGKLVQESRRNT